MMRPGMRVKRPATTSAPAKMAIMALRCLPTRWRRACKTASGSIASVKIASRWIGLHGPHMCSSWIQNELVATVTMSRTQIQPMVRWGIVPLGAASCTAPSPKAAKAAKACSWMAGAAFNSGASDTGLSPAHLTPRLRDCLNCAAKAATESEAPPSKRYLVVHVAALARAGQSRLLLARGRARGPKIILIRAQLAASAIPCPVEHGELRIEVLQHHLGGVFVLARLVLPFARLQLPLEINLRPLLQILLGDPAKSLIEDDHAVPLRALAALAGCLVAPSFRGRHAQIRDRAAVLRAPDLGVFAEIANQDHLIDATGHDALLLMCACPSEPNPKVGTKSPPCLAPSCFSTAGLEPSMGQCSLFVLARKAGKCKCSVGFFR